MNRFSEVELVGSQIRLRIIRPFDAAAAFDLLRDGVVARTLLWDGPSSESELVDAYQAREQWWQESEESEGSFAIELVDQRC